MDVLFPTDRLMTALSSRVHGTGGAAAIEELVENLHGRWPALRNYWRDRTGPRGFERLGYALLETTRESDRSDLVCNTVKLRNEFATYATNDFDINVGSQIGRSVIEALAENPRDAAEAALAIAGLEEIPHAFDASFLANLIVARIFLDLGDFDTAVEALRKNLKASTCPTSQYLLYQCLRAKRDSGRTVSSTEIFIDDLSDRFCSRPFDTLSTGGDGRRHGSKPKLHACTCPTSVPYPINGASIEEAWNGAEVQEIRRSILDGDFTYCSRLTCEQINGGTLPKRDKISDPWLRDIIDNHKTMVDRKPSVLSLGHDPSCNIACPSCRVDLMTLKNAEREDLERFNSEELLPFLEGSKTVLIVSNDGDPFYSKSYRSVLENLDRERHKDVWVAILTNGLLLTPKMWDSLSHIHARIGHVGVSIDAAEAVTYEDLRRPGKWEVITANMEFLAGLRRSGKLKSLATQFVVQAKNFREMARFVRLCKAWSVDKVMFIRLFNSGSFSGAAFDENDICNPHHPEHPIFIEMLRDPILRDTIVDLFTMTPVLNEVRSVESVRAATLADVG